MGRSSGTKVSWSLVTASGGARCELQLPSPPSQSDVRVKVLCRSKNATQRAERKTRESDGTCFCGGPTESDTIMELQSVKAVSTVRSDPDGSPSSSELANRCSTLGALTPLPLITWRDSVLGNALQKELLYAAHTNATSSTTPSHLQTSLSDETKT